MRNVIESELFCCYGINDDFKRGVTFEAEIGTMEAYYGEFRNFADIFCPERYGAMCGKSSENRCIYALSSGEIRDRLFPNHEFKSKPLHRGYFDYQKKGIK